MNKPLSFRWLGVAGIELRCGDETLIIDPFFTRPRFLRVWFGRAEPDHALIAEKIQRCDHILVTHAHHDHLMDVPDVMRNTGATVYGSPNTCGLLELCGAPRERTRRLDVGDRVELGPFRVEALPAEHTRVPGFGPGPLSPRLRPPLRIRDYRMDSCFSFLIEAAGQRLLDWGGSRSEQAPLTDVLFVAPLGPRKDVEALLRSCRPQIIVPIHWDDLFRPLSRPMKPLFEPPRLAWPPLRRMNPSRLAEIAQHVLPGAQTIVPEAFRRYEL